MRLVGPGSDSPKPDCFRANADGKVIQNMAT